MSELLLANAGTNKMNAVSRNIDTITITAAASVVVIVVVVAVVVVVVVVRVVVAIVVAIVVVVVVVVVVVAVLQLCHGQISILHVKQRQRIIPHTGDES